MGRLFGTDGVRGVFGRDLTTDLARSLGRAAVTVLARDADVAADVRDRSRHPCVGSDPGGRTRGGHRRRRGQRDPRRGRPDPGRRVPHDRARGRVRRGDLGLPQPARGQRDQVLRVPRVQAVGSPRGRDRGGDRGPRRRAAPGRARAPDAVRGLELPRPRGRLRGGAARRHACGRRLRERRGLRASRPPRSNAWAPR